MPKEENDFTCEEAIMLLRRQRHDFLNHMQIIYSCLELKKWDKAMEYIQNLEVPAPSGPEELRAILSKGKK